MFPSLKAKARITAVFGELAGAVVFLFLTSQFASSQNIVAWGANGSGQTTVPVWATNVVAVAAGATHSLALRADGTVICWGSITNVPDNITNATAIAAGASHNLVLLADGTVVAWGSNTFGQTTVPPSATNVIALTAGYNHNLALRADGTLISWGRNVYGQTNVPAIADSIMAIAAGAEHSMSLQNDGSISIWGGSTSYPYSAARNAAPRSLKDIMAISAGAFHSIALSPNGRVIVWGYTLNQPAVPSSATNIVAIAGGTNYSLALRTNGTILAWGTGAVTNVPSSATNIVSLAAGFSHALAVKGDGRPQILPPVAYHSLVSAGDPLPLVARAVGIQPLTYQWFADGLLIPDATNALPQVLATVGNDDVGYQVIVSNTFGSATSAVAKVSVRSINVWGDNANGQRRIPRAVMNPVVVAAGGFHILALEPDGAVVAWGKNSSGQTNVPAAATNVVGLAAGSDHSLALRDDGSVIAWGRNWDSQANVPPTATNIVSIAAGWAHSLGLRADGTVVAWGNNEYGQTSVSFLATEVVAVAAGYYHNLALRSDGRVVTWGWEDYVPPNATNVVAIAAGWGHSLALKADGTVLAWGDNTYGQSTVPSSATNVVALEAGFYHSLALRADGTVVAWGKAIFGVTSIPSGLANIASIHAGEDFNLLLAGTSPKFGRQLRSVVSHAGGQAVLNVAVQAGYPSTFQWFRDGIPVHGATNRLLVLTDLQTAAAGNYVLTVSNAFGQASSQPVNLIVQPNPVTQTAVGAWGDNVRGQCDIPPTLMEPRAISAGAFHSLALQADGTVVAWGKNVNGQTNVPPALTDVVAIAAGSDHSLALVQDGSVVAWGRNWDGQASVPPATTNVVAIAAGWTHSVALRDDGSVVAWGDNQYGQTNVPFLATDVVAIAAGYYHTLALRSDHKIVSWGSHMDVPASASNVVAVAAGWEHSLALRVDGTVFAWGENSYGQCNVPASATNIVSVSAGYGHSAALRADGTAVTWGTGSYGVTNVPSILRNVASIAAGENHSVALVEMGPPRIQREARSASAHVGGRAFFDADLRGTHPLTRQWLRNGLPIPGATNQHLLIEDLQAGDAGAYALAGTNTIAGISGQPANLTVLSSPSIATVSPDFNSPPEVPISIEADVSGTPPLSYQWRLNNVDLHDGPRTTGTDTASIHLNPAQYSDSGDYTLVVSNAQGVVTGLVARLVVTPLLAWGDNASGQLNVPMGVSNIVAVSAGGDHNLALRVDGTVFAWGDNSFGQTNVPALATNVIAAAAGGSHSLVLLASGRVLAWGDNTRGQTNVPSRATNIVAIAAGERHSLALASDGTVVAWGSGPTTVPASATNVIAIAAGDNISLALRADGSLVPWGSIIASNQFTAIAGGGGHRLALKPDGRIAAWGRSYYNQTTVPETATNIVAISAGGDHSLVLRNDGSVVSWGGNYSGQTNVPSAATNIAAVSTGGAHTLALVRQDDLPPITSQLPKAAELGQSVLLATTPQVGAAAAYQWQLNGKNILDATNSALFVTNLHWTNAGSYRVVISNSFGATIGSPVILTVLRTPLRFDPASLTSPTQTNVFGARLLGASGTGPVVIYASSNLVDWLPIYTNPPVIGSIDFTDPSGLSSSERLYRAAELFVPSPIQFETSVLARDNTNGTVRLQITGLSAASPVTIYASTNLNDWNPIFTNPPTIGPLDYYDSPATSQRSRFYRASESR